MHLRQNWCEHGVRAGSSISSTHMGHIEFDAGGTAGGTTGGAMSGEVAAGAAIVGAAADNGAADGGAAGVGATDVGEACGGATSAARACSRQSSSGSVHGQGVRPDCKQRFSVFFGACCRSPISAPQARNVLPITLILHDFTRSGHGSARSSLQDSTHAQTHTKPKLGPSVCHCCRAANVRVTARVTCLQRG